MCLCTDRAARAGGFEIYEESPAGTAMAGAMTAVPGDASAIFYNPAGIALQRGGGSALVGASLGTGSSSVLSADGVRTDAKPKFFPLPTAYVSAHLGSRFALGLGLFTQFGNGLAWNEMGTNAAGAMVKFPGRFIATDTELQTATINPTVAMKITDQVAMAAGIDVILASAELRRQVQLGDAEGSAHLGGLAQAVGFNVGVMAVVIPNRFNFGMAYRSSYTLNFDLSAHFGVPAELASAVKDQPAKLSLPMPHNFSVGVAVMPISRLTLTADVHVSLWSDFQFLTATFPTTNTPTLTAARNWHDSVSARLGLEFMATHGLALRLGFGYDQTPVPASTLDPTAPLSDRWLVSGGIGYTQPTGKVRGFGVGVGYLAGISPTRTSTISDFPGASYSQMVHVLSMALTYRWGGGCDSCEGGAAGGCKGCPHCGSVSQR